MAKSDKEIILELTIRKENLEKGIVKLESTIKKAKDANEDYSMSFKKVELAEIKLATVSAKLEKSQKGLANTVVASTKKMTQVKDATGSATAATMELSRVVSDAPYGIRGMANNITQLVSQLGTASTKAGGLTAALKLMWQSMMGPLGIVFAITAVVSAIDYFYGANTKAESSTSSFTDSIKELTTSLGDLSPTQEVVNEKIEDYIKLQILRKKIDKEQKDSQDKLADANENVAKYQDYYNGLKQQRLNLEARGIFSGEAYNLTLKGEAFYLGKLNGFTEERNALYRKGIELANKLTDATNTFKNSDNIKEGTVDWYKKRISDLSKIRDATAENTKEYKEQTKAIKVAQKELDKLQFKKGKDDAAIPFTAKWYEQKIKKETERRDSLSKTNEEYLAGTKKIAELQAKLDKIEGKNKALKPMKLKPIKIGETKKQMLKELKAVADAVNIDLKKDPLKIAPELNMELSDEQTQAAADRLKEIIKDVVLISKLEDYADFADKSKQILGDVNTFISGEFDRQMAMEQNKTNVLNEELNNRLLNENLSKDQRAKIQNQIAQNDDKLRKKQEAIQRKAFNVTKAFQLAMAIADGASSTLKAYGSQLVIGDPTSIVRATIAAKMAGAVALLNIATIARTKFQSTAPSPPSRVSGGGSLSESGGSGTGDRSFNFNLVGASQQNQLLSAIQAKFETPLKAFVVSKDITTQQELDVNIKGTATL